MTPSIFAGYSAHDETALMHELGDTAPDILRKHHQQFITQSDFAWIAAHGLNAVRIPVPYWVFGDIQPYVGSIDVLDRAMQDATDYNLMVILDLHTAPGSQNGWDHSGVTGSMEWHNDSRHISATLDVLERLAERYGSTPSLAGIEVLNEPHWDVPMETLQQFYVQAYQRIRRYCTDSVAVIFHDGFRPEELQEFMSAHSFSNVALDGHLYQCFAEEDKQLDMRGHIEKTQNQWDRYVNNTQKHHNLVIGEWSLALDAQSLHELDDTQVSLGLKAYGAMQLHVFRQATGWFFWTYKTEDSGGWNFRSCIEESWLRPDQWSDR